MTYDRPGPARGRTHDEEPMDTPGAAVCSILVAGGDPGAESGPAEVLRRGGFTVTLARTADEARARLAAAPVALLVTELRLPDGSGLDLLRTARRVGSGVPTVVVTAHGVVEDAVAAMKLGALDFLSIPFAPTGLLALAARLLERRHTTAPPRLGIDDFGGVTVREMERRLIVETLERTGNNRTQAAKLLGISIRTLRNKLAEYRARGVLALAPEPRI